MKKMFTIKKSFVIGVTLFVLTVLPLPIDSAINQSSIAKAASVTEDQNEVKVNVKNKSLVKDSTYNLKVYNLLDDQKVYFKSKDTSIATVDKDGVITANGIGTTIISITVKEGFRRTLTFECNVTVGPPAISITLTRQSLKITEGKKRSLKTILKPNNTVDEVFYSSSNESIATVDSNGRVTAISTGDVVITAYVSSKLKDACIVTVVTEITDETDDE